MPPSDDLIPEATEPVSQPPADPLADARDAALVRDRGIVDALVGPVAAHFKEAVEAEQALAVIVTVIVSPSHAQSIPILPSSVDDPERQRLAIYLAAQQFGKAHAIYTKRTGQNLQLAARQPDE